MRTLTYLLAWLVLAIPCSAKIIYVDADATGANDGSSWADAYNYLQDALMMASSGAEIQVAEGIYKPHLNSYSLAPVSRADTFRLKNGVTIKGGYAGSGEPDPDARDISSYVSVLSGDMNGNDAAVGSPEELLTEPTRADNSYHVVTAIGVDANAVLDGFSITGGQANGGTYEFTEGGGMYNYDASPTVTDCTFGANSAAERGGGMYIFNRSSAPTLSRCTFTFNQAGAGGGIMSYGVPMLTRCTFIMNVAGLGGGMYSSGGELSRCVFGGNRSEYKGGGIFMSYDTSMTSCMLSGNSADSGGAVFAEDCDITVMGCTIVGNRASYVGGVHNDEGKTFVSNCILRNNMDADGEDESAQIGTADPPSIDYCCIQGWTGALGGTGNIGANPVFVQAGHWDTAGAWVDGDYHLLSSSPCINAGDPSYIAGPNETDLEGNPRVIGGRVDIGVYEIQPWRILYVDEDVSGNNDGSSWADAYNYLQDALMMASIGDEIRVAEGTYKPDQFVLSRRPNMGRAETFQLKNGVVIKGGYAGFGETDPDAHDVEVYKTILSGDLMGNDTPGLSPENLLTDSSRSDNSWTVVSASGLNRSAVLDGCTICGGQSDSKYTDEPAGNGGGIYMVLGNPTLKNCTFRANAAARSGGGILNDLGLPLLLNCCFEANYCDWSGGGLCNLWGSPTLQGCRFEDNYAGTGAGLYNLTSSVLTLDRCTFNSNVTTYRGGGIMLYEYGGPTILNNCLLAGNQALEGGAIGCDAEVSGTLILNNCTVAENEAEDIGGGIFSRYGGLEINNCIFWANADSTGYTETAQIHVPYPAANYTCVQGLTGQWPGVGNIGSDPFFAASPDGNYHLLEDSPCIDSGDPNYVAGPDETDLDGNDRVICGRIDMGAYEFHCPQVFYVDADATGNNDGSSWTDAYNLLQDALASSSCEGDEIRVAQGVYKPDQGVGNIAGDREATFQLKNGVPIRGGYAGFGETEPDACDVDLYETVLSGDLAGDDVGDLLDASRAENSYHVVTGSDTDLTAVLDGFTVTSGNAFNTKCSSNDSGGGMYNNNGSPTVVNCTFTRNTASDQCGGGGAGMYNNHSNPRVINCEFVGNEYIIADDDGGGGMNNYRSNPTLIDCSFKDNKSSGYGGGMLNYRSNPTLTNCIFINNSSTYNGGGMENLSSSPALTYCSFISNSAVGGGAIYITGEFQGTLTDCLFENNTAALGGGAIYCTGGGELSIIRCEFRNGTANRGGVIYNGYASLILSECILESNQAKYAGAVSTGGDITLTNCLLANNQALVYGGALDNMGYTSRSVNCTFVGNSANHGGAIFSNIECDTTVINSIFWNNTAQTGSQIATSGDHGGSTLTVNYCDIENGLDGLYVPFGCALNWGEGNIDAEPVFADSGNGDYRLSAGSPCVDVGDNDSVPPDVCDLDGNARIYDGDGDGSLVVDMGAYELSMLPLEVPMKLVPQALNPGSHGKWIKAHFVLPERYTIEDVDTSRPAEFEQFQLTSESMEVFVNKEDLVEIVAAFDRSAFCGIGPFEGEVAVVGYLTSGRRFRGTDTIKMVNNKFKYLGVLASHWLSVCSAPDWCNGADLDHDSEVNFVDFALLDGCCFEVIKD